MDVNIKKTAFAEMYERACNRKGGEKVVKSLIAPAPEPDALAKASDDRVLAEMAKCVFRAGFNWKVIEAKWPGFEDAFLGFEPGWLHFQPDEFWDDLTSNKAIVRHGAKIRSVRLNGLTTIRSASGIFWRNGATAWVEIPAAISCVSSARTCSCPAEMWSVLCASPGLMCLNNQLRNGI